MLRVRRKNSKLSLVGALMAVVVLMSACAGDTDDVNADSADTAEPAIGFPDDDASSAPAAIPTTAPLVVTTEETPTEVPAEVAVVADLAVEDPNEVTVLHANENIGTVPVFDGPNGENITLYDVNALDGNARLEYPLNGVTHFGNPLALLVEEFDASGNWAKVYVPVRPNGTTAWVQTAFFTPETHNYHITISLSQNKVNVYKGDDLLVEQIAVIGRDSRPTPVLRSYIDEKIAGPSLSAAYGDWVLSIAAYSESLGSFNGNLPKLALHGTNQPELMGQAVSSGCVRIPNEVVSFIADNVPVGTVVDIVA